MTTPIDQILLRKLRVVHPGIADEVDKLRPEFVQSIVDELTHATHVETTENVEWKLDSNDWNKVQDMYDERWLEAYRKRVSLPQIKPSLLYGYEVGHLYSIVICQMQYDLQMLSARERTRVRINKIIESYGGLKPNG